METTRDATDTSGTADASQTTATAETDETVRTWMVERTFSEDSPHILVLVYATLDGSSYLQKERAFNRFGSASSAPVVTAAEDVPREDLAPVDDEQTRERYATEAHRMRERHAPGDAV